MFAYWGQDGWIIIYHVVADRYLAVDCVVSAIDHLVHPAYK